MDGFLLVKIMTRLALPPIGNLLLWLLGMVLAMRWRMTGRVLQATALVSLLLFTIPYASIYLMRSLEDYPPLSDEALATGNAQAIVVLAAGRIEEAPEYGKQDITSTFSLERLRYAVRLHRHTGLPILVSGGIVFGERESESEAALMARALREEFDVRVKWLEDKSRNTYENALYTQQLLSAEGIDNVYVVTHAWHMYRAMKSFAAVGLSAQAAPTMFVDNKPHGGMLNQLLPSAGALRKSSLASYEYLGRFWYQLRYY